MPKAKNIILIIVFVVIICLLGVGLLFIRGDEDTWLCVDGEWVRHGNPDAPMPESGCLNAKQNLIRLDVPKPNQKISSPLILQGEARGPWFFEGSFPVKLFDQNNNLLYSGIAQTQFDWMSEGFVPFTAQLEFDATQLVGQTGKLVLEKDNPSGLAANDDQLVTTIIFDEPQTTSVDVYFGNTELNPNSVDCSKVFLVKRQIPKTVAVARGAIGELLKGPTKTEKEEGYHSSINSGVKLRKLKIDQGVAYIDFDEQLEYQLGGSCRVAAIRSQIVETLKQFPTIKDVVISVDDRVDDILQP